MTKAQLGKLRELQTSQLTVSEIAAELNCKKSDVRKALFELGYKPIESKEPAESEFLKGKKPVEIPKRSYRRITPETERRICELREQCFTCEQIKVKLNICSNESVRQILIKNGYSTKRGEFHKIKEETKEEAPVKLTKINEGFEEAVKEMEKVNEKEPATVAPVTDSLEKQEITPVIPDNNDTTSVTESQSLSGVAALNLMQEMISDWTGMAADIVSLYAKKDQAELVFSYEGKEYRMMFGENANLDFYGR